MGPAEGPDEGEEGGLWWRVRGGEEEAVGFLEVVGGDEGEDLGVEGWWAGL